MKRWFKSKILLTNLGGGLVFMLDAAHSFLISPTFDNLCAQKSALAAGVMFITGILRFYTSTAIGKEQK